MAFDDVAGFSGGVFDVGQETQPLGEFLRSLLRYLPLVLAGAIALSALIYAATAPSEPEPVADAQIGLTGEVVWPFFDVAKQRAISTAEEPAFAEAVRSQLGDVPLNDFRVESDETRIIVHLIAESDTPANAAVAANTAAQLLIDDDADRVLEGVRLEIDRTRAILDDSIDRVAVIDTRLEELATLEASAQAIVAEDPESSSAREELILVSTERGGLSQARGEEIRQQVGLSIDLDRLEAQLEATANELELVGPAVAVDDTAQRSLVPPLAAFVGTVVAGLGVAVVWDRARGRIRSPWYVEQLTGIRSVGQINSKHWEQSTGVVLSNLVSLTAGSDQKILALGGLPHTAGAAWQSIVMYYLTEAGFRIVEVVDNGTSSGMSIQWHELRASHSRRESLRGKSQIVLPPNMRLLDAPHMRPVLGDVAGNCDLVLIAGGEVGSQQWDRAVALADAVVLLVTENQNRVDELKAAAVAVMARQSRLTGSILVPKKLPSMRFVADYSPQVAGRTPHAAGPPRSEAVVR